ncbi:mevalonate kinase family protein [Mangrovibacterium lignilyticum]|uniref:mevalonate kinase family protein n=1 Tax=Mangrovibacterium lignilyticum TaxID=2668052 RepID=UPI0013D4B3B5|nr:hypothetical protein [Mangrovibacterium lignilyticum]
MKKYPAKLLLFGEYGLMFGAKALAVPFPKFKGYFAKMDIVAPNECQQNSATELDRFASWFEDKKLASQMNFPLDVEKLKSDLESGLYFESDIPLQYGVGSSGALCAGLYDRYGSFLNQNDFKLENPGEIISRLREDFIVLESYFHGRSSGLDPLVSFLNRPVLVENGKIWLPDLKLEDQPWKVYLIDTGITSPTSPLVKIFLEKMETADFSDLFQKRYLPANDATVEAFQNNEKESFFHQLGKFHEFQLKHFQEMIPDSCLGFISELKMKGILVKLLGSGGGGFLLAFAPTDVVFPQTKKSFRIF